MKNIKVTKLTDPISNGSCNGYWIGCPREAVYLIQDKDTTIKACTNCTIKHLGTEALKELLK